MIVNKIINSNVILVTILGFMIVSVLIIKYSQNFTITSDRLDRIRSTAGIIPLDYHEFLGEKVIVNILKTLSPIDGKESNLYPAQSAVTPSSPVITSNNVVQVAINDSIFTRIYPSVLNYSIVQLKDSERITVFVYDLPSKFNADLLSIMESKRVKSNCDYARSPCIEKDRDDENFSVHRQYAAEVPILAKLLSVRRTTDPEKADFFVVPFFSATSKTVQGDPWNANANSINTVREVLSFLPHFKNEYMHRHIFLSSKDYKDTSLFRVSEIASSAIILHYGPKQGKRDIVIPPNDAGFGYPLSPINLNPPYFIFTMIGIVNGFRQIWFKHLKALSLKAPELNMQLFEIVNHRVFTISISEVRNYMVNSLLCPIPQGDMPYQHRLYDVMVAGCVPVVLAHSNPDNSTSYFQGVQGSSNSDLNSIFPFPDQIPWKEIIVEISVDNFSDEEKFVQFFLSLNRTEILIKREKLASIRKLFLYDWTGSDDDAFTGIIVEMEKTLT